MKRLFAVWLILLLTSGFYAHCQELYRRVEIAAPIHPFTVGFGNYYGQYEHYLNPRRSWLGTFGYKGDEVLYLLFKNVSYKGYRVDYGQRLYFSTPLRWFQLFAAANLNVEVGKLTLHPYGLQIPKDSLEMKGLMVGPELNFGGKITILKRVSVTGLIGYRYYINNFKTENITFNPDFWRFDDWNNRSHNWIVNRSYVENFKNGHYPVIQLNVAYVIGLRKRVIPSDSKTSAAPFSD